MPRKYSQPYKDRACCSVQFLHILHLTFSGREPLPWPQAMKRSRAPKATSRCVLQLLPGCCKHTQLTAAFVLIVLGTSLTGDQHPPRDTDISAASPRAPGTPHFHHSLQMPVLIFNISILLFPHQSSLKCLATRTCSLKTGFVPQSPFCCLFLPILMH